MADKLSNTVCFKVKTWLGKLYVNHFFCFRNYTLTANTKKIPSIGGNMFLISLLLNTTVFFVIINFKWIVSKTRFSAETQKTFPDLVLPLALGLVLAILDAFRLAFFYDFFLLIVLFPLTYLLIRKIRGFFPH